MPPKSKSKAPAPTLVVSKLVRLPKDAGSKVKLSLKPNKKANYTAYQNVKMKIGSDTYTVRVLGSLEHERQRRAVRFL
eukprot:COSAG05_NODE_4043_length_1703_cov_2.033666_3_plen_78_part_00